MRAVKTMRLATMSLGVATVLLLAGARCTFSQSSVASLIESLRNSDEATRMAAGEQLIGYAATHFAEVLPTLTKALGDRSAEIRFHCATAMGAAAQVDESNAKLLQKATRELTSALRDKDPRVREASASAIGVMMPAPPASATPSLIKGLEDSERRVRSAVLGALARMQELDATALQRVVRVLKEDRSSQVRGDAAKVLGGHPADGAEIVSALISAVADQDLFVRQQAVRALGRLGPAAEPAVSTLEAIAKDLSEDPTLRKHAEYSLRSINKRALD